MSADNAASAGRLVITLLFAANALAYFVDRTGWAVAGLALAIVGATAGYAAACLEDADTGNLVPLGLSVLACAGSGACFLIGAT